MTRPEHLRAARLSVRDIKALLDAVAAVAEPVTLAFLWRPILPDGDDDMVLEAAVNGRADAIVTFIRVESQSKTEPSRTEPSRLLTYDNFRIFYRK